VRDVLDDAGLSRGARRLHHALDQRRQLLRPALRTDQRHAVRGHGAPHNADKEWLAIDWYPGSSLFTDRLYVAWSDIDQEPWQI
jgi:hypothetical protein